MSGGKQTGAAIRAFLFDLDGTLIDSELLWCRSIRQMMEAKGMPITESYSLELVLGRAWRDIAGRLRQDHPALTETDEALVVETNRYYAQLRGKTDIRIHSSIVLLKRLAGKYPVAVVSGSTRGQVTDAIEMMGVSGYLQFYFGNEDYPRGKPHPDCFLMAAQRLGIVPAECLVFEDSSAGVRSAKAAGMKCVALQRDSLHRQDVSAADQVLSDLAEFDPCAFGVRLD